MGSVLNPQRSTKTFPRAMTAECAETAPHPNPLPAKCGEREKELPLPLIAREQALHRPRPSLKLPLARRRAHRRLEAMLEPPVVGEFCRLGIDAGGKPREIRGTERCGFLDHRALGRRVPQICKSREGP